MRLQDMRNVNQNCILLSALCFELSGTASSEPLDWLFLDLPLRAENGSTQFLQIPDRHHDQRQRRTLTESAKRLHKHKNPPIFLPKSA